MRRLLQVAFTILLVFACVSCGNSDTFVDGAVSTEISESSESSDRETAQAAYDLIEEAEMICKKGMADISAAWQFGIWDATECSADTVMEKLAAKISFDVTFIEENGGYTREEMVNGDEDFPNWEFCLSTAINCLVARGDYGVVDESLDEARKLIRGIPEEHTNYQGLKNYYSKVAAYVAYFEDITGSYNDLTEAISEYENNIRDVKEDLLFDFG